MVNSKKLWIQICLIVLVGIISVGLLSHYKNEKRHVRRQFKLLSESISLSFGEGMLAQGLKSKRLGDLFAEESTLSIPVHSLSGQYSRTEIAQNSLAAKNRCEKLSLNFFDLTIEFSERTQANVTTTARIKGQTRTGEVFNEVRELHCTLYKTDGDWLFSACTVGSILTR